MLSFNVDLGQIIIGILITILSYFVRSTLTRVETRLDRHDVFLSDLSGAVNRLTGMIGRGK